MALGPDALTDFATVKARLPQVLDTDQSEIEALIDAASALANQYARRRLAAREYTVELDGSGRDTLVLPAYPIGEVSAVYIDSARAFPDASAVTDYVRYDDEGILYRAAGWPAEKKNVRVVYTAGLDPVPADLRDAVLEVVAYNLRRFRGDAIIGVKSMSLSQGLTTQYELTIPVNAQRVFESYRDGRI